MESIKQIQGIGALHPQYYRARALHLQVLSEMDMVSSGIKLSWWDIIGLPRRGFLTREVHTL
jgi:hypothetical protein